MAIGIGEDYTAAARSTAVPFEDLRMLATNNLRVLRVSFPWAEIEQEPNQFDWAFWDRFVDAAGAEFGITLVPYVCYTPKWASSRPELADFWRYPPKNPDLFGRFMREIATRYHGKVHSWELWNEPDNPEYWRGTIKEFSALVQSGSQAVRSVDSNATLVLGGLSWDLGFFANVLYNQAAAVSDLQVLNLHNYYETWSGDALERLPDYVGRAADMLTQHGLQWRLWMAEVGYSSYRSNGYVSGQFAALYDYEHTDAYQAVNLFRTMTTLLGTGKVSLATWYRIHDLPPGVEVIGDQNNRYLGVLNTNGCAKPALQALSFFNRLFSRGARIRVDVRIQSSVRSRLEAYAFERSDGSLVLVSWLPTVVPGQRSSGDRAKTDPRSEVVVWTLLEQPPGNPRRFDHLGRPAAKSVKAERQGREIRICDGLQGGEVSVITFSPFR